MPFRVAPRAVSLFRRKKRRNASPRYCGPVIMAMTELEMPKAVRGLPGATVLHILPALTETPAARAAVDIAVALLRSGARVIVAAEDGPLNSELQGLGGEWVRLVTDTSQSAQRLAQRPHDRQSGLDRARRSRACGRRRRLAQRVRAEEARRRLAGAQLCDRWT